jgi:hypothetical protein
MNELGLSSNLVFIKNSRHLVRFGFEGQKYSNSDFQSHFSMSKIDQNLNLFFFIEEYRKGRPSFIVDIFL